MYLKLLVGKIKDSEHLEGKFMRYIFVTLIAKRLRKLVAYISNPVSKKLMERYKSWPRNRRCQAKTKKEKLLCKISCTSSTSLKPDPLNDKGIQHVQ